jgi:hypothetical protein
MHKPTITLEAAAKQVVQAARTAAYHHGAGLTFADIRAMVPSDVCDQFVARFAELAGFPVWASAPTTR